MKQIFFSSLVAAALIFPRSEDKLPMSSYTPRDIGGKTVYVDRLNPTHLLIPFSKDKYYDCLDVDKDGKIDRITVRQKSESNFGLESDCDVVEKDELANPYLFQHMNKIYSKMRK